MLRVTVTIIALLFLSSCNNNSERQLTIYKVASKGLFQSSESLANNNNVVYRALEQRLFDPSSAERAKIWQPKALLIKVKSDSLFNYLNFLIIELKKKADLRLIDFKEVFDETNKEAVKDVLSGNNSAEQLSSKLLRYKNEILGVDPELNAQFSKNITIGSTLLISDNDKASNNAQNIFDDINVTEAILIFRKLQNEIRNTEGELILFCLNKIPSTDGCGYDVYRTIIGQSSTIVKGGESIKIQAGIGAFSASPNPSVFIDGKVLKPQDGDGYVEYSFKTPIKAGKYTKNVTIEFIKEDGTKQKNTTQIEYTVKD